MKPLVFLLLLFFLGKIIKNIYTNFVSKDKEHAFEKSKGSETIDFLQ